MTIGQLKQKLKRLPDEWEIAVRTPDALVLLTGALATADALILDICAGAEERERESRIQELTAKIPPGTYCTETNCCGGYLTDDEVNELEQLFRERGY
jgi:hypothetical protein